MGILTLMLLQSLAMALFTIFSRPLAVKLKDAQFQVTAIIFTGLYLISLPVAFLFSNVQAVDFTEWWLHFIVIGIAFGFHNVTLFWALRYMDAALAALVSTLGIVTSVIMATTFLGEGLTLQQLVGAAVIIGAIYYVLIAHVNPQERRNWTLGLILSIISAVLVGFGATGEKYLLGEMEFGSYLVWGWGLQWLVLAATSLFYMRGQYKVVLQRTNARLLSLATITRSLGALGFVAAQLIIGNLSKVVVLSGLRVILVALLGVAILHERQFIRRKLFAAGLAAIGVAIMFW